MAAGNNALWRSVCETVSRPDLLDDERFESPTTRAQHQTALRDILEQEFARADADEWLQKFRQAGVPCSPINTYSEVLADPQVAHMNWVQSLTLPTGRETQTFASPVKMSEEDNPIRLAPPELGEHNEEILAPLRARMENKA